MLRIDWFIQGGPVMWPLLACSVVTLTVAIERTLFWLRVRRGRDAARLDRVCELAAAGRGEEAAALCGGTRDPIARVMLAGLDPGRLPVEASIEKAASTEIRGMRRYLRVLDTIVTLAPLLGILGTIMGIIVAFDVIGGGEIDNPVEVIGGVAQALLTTAAGLVVAILALLPYNWFSTRMEGEVAEMESRITGLRAAFRPESGREHQKGTTTVEA